MENILLFAKEISPLGVIALLVVVVFQLVKGKDVINSIRGTQKTKYPVIETDILQLKSSITHLTEQNTVLLENHFQHEIPEIMRSQERIEQTMMRLTDKIEIGNSTLIRIEAKLK